MHADLQLLDRQVAAALKRLNVRQTQLTPREHPEKWGTQQIVEHLLLSMRASTLEIEARITKRTSTGSQPTLVQRVMQWVVLGLGRFPNGRRAPAAVSPNRPTALRRGSELAEKMHAALAEYDEVATRAEALFGSQRAVSHVILGPLSMAQWRRFHILHVRHHLRQVARIQRDRRT